MDKKPQCKLIINVVIEVNEIVVIITHDLMMVHRFPVESWLRRRSVAKSPGRAMQSQETGERETEHKQMSAK